MLSEESMELLIPASWVWITSWVQLCFPDGSDGKESACNTETQVWSLGQEDLLKKGLATHLGFLPGDSHGQRSLVSYSPWVCKESDTNEQSPQISNTYLLNKWINIIAKINTRWLVTVKSLGIYMLHTQEMILNHDLFRVLTHRLPFIHLGSWRMLSSNWPISRIQ